MLVISRGTWWPAYAKESAVAVSISTAASMDKGYHWEGGARLTAWVIYARVLIADVDQLVICRSCCV